MTTACRIAPNLFTPYYELLLGMRSLYNWVGIRDKIINRARKGEVNNENRESLPNCRETSYLIITIMSRQFHFNFQNCGHIQL